MLGSLTLALLATAAAQPIPRHCRVTLVLKPTPDSNLHSELWMPAENWACTAP